jgi:hypothetical protein
MATTIPMTTTFAARLAAGPKIAAMSEPHD